MKNMFGRGKGFRTMKKFLLSALLAAFFTLSGAVPGIYLAPGAPLPEENAAMELQKGLKRIFGFSAPIFRKDRGSCTFFVGQSPAAGKVLGIADFSVFKPDEILLKKVNGRVYSSDIICTAVYPPVCRLIETGP